MTASKQDLNAQVEFRFIHAADLHLGCSFQGVHAINPRMAQELRAATYAAFDAIIDAAIARAVDLVVIAGDIYNSNENSLRPQLAFRDGMQRLHEAGIPCCVVHGNHDPHDGSATHFDWPANCHRFATTPGEPFIVTKNGVPIAAVVGISYAQRDVREKLAQHYKLPAGGLFTIGLLHTNCGGNSEHANYAPSTPEELRALGFDYWALGHIHKPTILGPNILYPGSPQGLNPNEPGLHGCLYVEVNAEREFGCTPIDTARIIWHGDTVDAQSWQNEQGALEGLEAAVYVAREAFGQRPVFLRLTVIGRTPLHGWLNKPATQADLLERLRGLYVDDGWVWVQKLRIATQPTIDFAARAQSDDIVGEVLRQAEVLHADAVGLDAARSELNELFGHARAGRHLTTPTDDVLRDLLQRAARHVADRLTEGEGD